MNLIVKIENPIFPDKDFENANKGATGTLAGRPSLEIWRSRVLFDGTRLRPKS